MDEVLQLRVVLEDEALIPLRELLRFLDIINKFYAARWVYGTTGVDRHAPYFWYRVTERVDWNHQLFVQQLRHESPTDLLMIALAVPPAVLALHQLAEVLSRSRQAPTAPAE